MGNFWTVLFVHLAKYESISMVPKVYSIHFCTTVCQFEKPEKRHFLSRTTSLCSAGQAIVSIGRMHDIFEQRQNAY